MIGVDVNLEKIWLMGVIVTKDIHEIVVFVNVNVINHVILVNT